MLDSGLTNNASQGWEVVGDQVRTTNVDSGEAYLVLILSITSGFMEPDDFEVYGTITFVFELECEDDCQLYFMKVSGVGGFDEHLRKL